MGQTRDSNQNEKFAQQQQALQESLRRRKNIKLVVVMSAVDWWKSSPVECLGALRPAGVRWNFLRLFGKRVAFGMGGSL
jgi:hypothetical protein